ncbi:MAG: hypothetical protein WCG20_00795 [bacterium]
MKKVFIMVTFLALCVGCGKENILWLEPGHEYEITNILNRNQNGTWDEPYKSVGQNGVRYTFTKFHPLGLSGDGEVTIVRGNAFGSQTETYHFTWDKESQRKISLKFSRYDPIIQGQNPNQVSFFETLNGDYIVAKDSRLKGQLVAHTIVLRNDYHEIILRQ